MRHPVDNPTISQGYQDNKWSYGYGAFGHTGIDYGVGEGNIVRAVHSGTVVGVGTNSSYVGGLYVIVSGSGGYQAYTGHMSRIDVSHGQSVSEGQQIGLSGRTGYVTGPHVHFQVRDSAGNLVNPLSLITNSAPSGAVGGDVITANDVGRVRVINSEVEGYPLHATHAGAYDAVEMKAWTGNSFQNLIDQKWRQGEAFRTMREAKSAFYDTWANKVGELSTRPTKAELDAINVALKASHQAVLDAEAKLALQLAKPPEVIKEQVEVDKPFTDQDGMNWLKKKINQLFGRAIFK